MLDSVDTSVGDLDSFIKSNKAGLKSGELDEQLNGLAVVFFQLGDVGSSFAETGQIIRVRSIGVGIEYWQKYS